MTPHLLTMPARPCPPVCSCGWAYTGVLAATWAAWDKAAADHLHAVTGPLRGRRWTCAWCRCWQDAGNRVCRKCGRDEEEAA